MTTEKMSLDVESPVAAHAEDKSFSYGHAASRPWLQIWPEPAKIPLNDLVPLGCLTSLCPFEEPATGHWREIFEISLLTDVPFFVDAPRVLDKAVQRLLKAGWIRLFAKKLDNFFIYRVYLLPDDIGRATVARGSRTLRAEFEQLLPRINTAPELWNGLNSSNFKHFDSWAQAEEGSLFYIFNTLPSPDPRPEDIEDRYSRTAVTELLDYDRLLSGLQTPLYPYQARSAAAMIQRESSTELQLDPRFEKRLGPDGSLFYYIPKDLAFYRNPPLYDSHRGGILAETMGLGKTIICLAVILATKGHLPKIPPQYQREIVRETVPRLLDLCISTAGRHSIPAKAHFSRFQRESGEELINCMKSVDHHEIDYFIPGKAPRSNRRTLTPPPKRMVLCSGTIIVVPRNIVHQWKSELRKHIINGSDGLKVLMMDSPSDRLPPVRDLRHYDVVLFSKPRFEKEIMDGSDKFGRNSANVRPTCNCLFYRHGMDEQCICLREEDIYHSPLKDLHWLRIIIDEGHEFSSATSNAVLVAEKLITAERRWVVSGTPARDRLYGVEADFAVTADYAVPGLYMEDSESMTSSEVSTPMEAFSTGTGQAFKLAALERRKTFNPQEDVGNASATKSLGLLAQHFLKIRPWYQEQDDQRTFWDDHIYRHEHFRNKTYTSFSGCLRRTLQNLVIKTQPEDVERDITLPPLTHTAVRLEPSFYDKLTANLFVLVLTANAITSERTDVDYLFHKNSAKERYRLITNLRQSNFVWTGFSKNDVESAIKTSWEYLNKENTKCSQEDRELLVSCLKLAEIALQSPGWAAVSKNHEIGLFINDWPDDSSEIWTLHKTPSSLLIGAAQLLQAQNFVNNQLFTENPSEGLQVAGEAASIVMEIKAAEESTERTKNGYVYSSKRGIPKSAVNSELFGTKRHPTASQKGDKLSPVTRKVVKISTEVTKKVPESESTTEPAEPAIQVTKMSRKRKREMDARELDTESALRRPSIIGTVSAKLTYLLDRISELYKEEKIIVFYDGDNAAFYLSQCLDILHIKHLIYTKALSSEQRSRYVVTFDTDDSIRVLLMDIRCGAFGLNVNKASRVFFINPVCRPSTEAQAIKRAHRIGQLKPVYVETLVLNNTIEAGIFERSKKMTQVEHFEANQLSDDKGIAQIIQTARAIPVGLEEGEGERHMAKLSKTMQIFGRPGRGDTKIRGIDRDWDTIESPATDKKARAKSGKRKPGKIEAMEMQMRDDTPVLSGVDWMNRPLTDSSLRFVTQSLSESSLAQPSLGHAGESMASGSMELKKETDSRVKSVFG